MVFLKTMLEAVLGLHACAHAAIYTHEHDTRKEIVSLGDEHITCS